MWVLLLHTSTNHFVAAVFDLLLPEPILSLNHFKCHTAGTCTVHTSSRAWGSDLQQRNWRCYAIHSTTNSKTDIYVNIMIENHGSGIYYLRFMLRTSVSAFCFRICHVRSKYLTSCWNLCCRTVTLQNGCLIENQLLHQGSYSCQYLMSCVVGTCGCLEVPGICFFHLFWGIFDVMSFFWENIWHFIDYKKSLHRVFQMQSGAEFPK
jgi:hypothetical protein